MVANIYKVMENVTENHGVGGSIPPLGTIIIKHYQQLKRRMA